MEKSYRKCAPKLDPEPFLIFVINRKQPLHERSFFSFEPSPFNGQYYEKQKVPGTSDQLLGKYRKEGKKIQKFEYFQNEKSFLDEIKSIFHSF